MIGHLTSGASATQDVTARRAIELLSEGVTLEEEEATDEALTEIANDD